MARTRTANQSTDLRVQLDSYVGRFANKTPDWDAFPANHGFPELVRAQMRYIGAGGSPKVDDSETMAAGKFTLSLVHQPVGKYAASHLHDVEEAFLVLQGVLTVGWDYDGEIVEARLGPRDMILNAPMRPHGFRNDGVEPVLMSIMVANRKPISVTYKYHPRDCDPVRARYFGVGPGEAERLGRVQPNSNHHDMERWITRYSQQEMEWHDAGFGYTSYIGEGAAPPGQYRMDLVHLSQGRGVEPYRRDVEDAYLVLSGSLTVGWEEDGKVTETRLGARDVVFNPPGRAHYFRNNGFDEVQFMMVVGTPEPENVAFKAC